MDLDLSSITSKLQDILPFISYGINMLRRVISVIAAYFGYDIRTDLDGATEETSETL